MRYRAFTVAVIACVLVGVFAWQRPIFAAGRDSEAFYASLAALTNSLYLPLLSRSDANTATSAACTQYVNNTASQDGNGSFSQPFKSIKGHTTLSAGMVLCLRGTTSGAPRVYPEGPLSLMGNGTATQPIVLQAYPGEKVSIQSTGLGVIQARGNYWVIQNLTLDDQGNGFPDVVVYGQFISLRGNDIFNGTYNGIDVRGTDALIDGNKIHNFDSHVPGSDAHCVTLETSASRLTLSGNTIHDCSGDGFQAYNPNNSPAAVVPTDVKIINNIFYRGSLQYTENAIDTKTGSRFTISGNDISGYGYEPVQVVLGGNPAVMFHRYSQNMSFIGNKVHDSTKGVNIYADQGATPSGIIVENNLVYNVTGSLGVNAYGIQVTTANNVTIANNTVVNTAGYALSIFYGNGGRIQNNLVYKSGPSRYTGLASITVGNNGYFSSSSTGSIGSNNTNGTTPLFVNSASDYHLTTGSPAIQKGASIGLWVDFAGHTRVAPPDLGAYAYAP